MSELQHQGTVSADRSAVWLEMTGHANASSNEQVKRRGSDVS